MTFTSYVHIYSSWSLCLRLLWSQQVDMTNFRQLLPNRTNLSLLCKVPFCIFVKGQGYSYSHLISMPFHLFKDFTFVLSYLPSNTGESAGQLKICTGASHYYALYLPFFFVTECDLHVTIKLYGFIKLLSAVEQYMLMVTRVAILLLNYLQSCTSYHIAGKFDGRNLWWIYRDMILTRESLVNLSIAK